MPASRFTEQDLKRITAAIGSAERKTSGEIRVHIEKICPEDVLDHAAFIFEKLEMHKTKQRNGVLIYLSLDDHKFAILGDAGIHAKVEPDFWDSVKEKMLIYLKQDKIVEALEQGIALAAEKLVIHFPFDDTEGNQLSNDVSFG
ncbi:MAG: TPM domain-containing protein [Luteibaculaceae bacterium]